MTGFGKIDKGSFMVERDCNFLIVLHASPCVFHFDTVVLFKTYRIPKDCFQ